MRWDSNRDGLLVSVPLVCGLSRDAEHLADARPRLTGAIRRSNIRAGEAVKGLCEFCRDPAGLELALARLRWR